MLRRHRPFWIILIITALVGLGTILSEHNDYSMSLHVEWMGFDTSRYAVSYADTLLPVSVNVNGFNAIVCYFKAKDRHYVIQAHGDTVVKVGKPLFDDIVDQMEFVGVHGVSSIVEQLRLKLSERQAKAFRPELRDVDFSFDGQYGLAGEPGITPDTVWLYGSPESLARIDRLYTLPTHIRGLSDTTCCSLALNPVWKRYPDLRASTDSVSLFIPVERFTEKTVSVPVSFVAENNEIRARLYPERVDVTFWVSSRDYDRFLDDMVQAVVEYNPDENQEVLPVLVKKFPASARIKTVTPSTIRYVIIK